MVFLLLIPRRKSANMKLNLFALLQLLKKYHVLEMEIKMLMAQTGRLRHFILLAINHFSHETPA